VIISDWVWIGTIVAIGLVITADLILVDSKPGEFGPREATRWVLFYIGLAVAFGIMLYFWQGPQYSAEFFAGYLTEYSLSIDNLFVFMLLITSFAVPPVLQHRVLLIGIVIALFLRLILIIVGSALITKFEWVFFIFGGFLLYTAWHVWRADDQEPDPDGNAIVKFVRKRVPVTPDYVGHQMLARVDGKRAVTPMALVILAIGTTDLLFAVDSIPAVFGLTKEPYIVFTVNAFALMGLRQLYFLLSGLLSKLIYLSQGLAIILLFIGLKLILEALHGTFGVHVPEIPVWFSLLFIVVTLGLTALLSLRAVKKHPELAKKVMD
jgi:tellurite resistance protein TerC